MLPEDLAVRTLTNCWLMEHDGTIEVEEGLPCVARGLFGLKWTYLPAMQALMTEGEKLKTGVQKIVNYLRYQTEFFA